jgi:hypothetical protein
LGACFFARLGSAILRAGALVITFFAAAFFTTDFFTTAFCAAAFFAAGLL